MSKTDKRTERLKDSFNFFFVKTLSNTTNPWDETDKVLYRAFAQMTGKCINMISVRHYMALCVDRPYNSVGDIQKFYPEHKKEIERFSTIIIPNTLNAILKRLADDNVPHFYRMLENVRFVVTEDVLVCEYYDDLMVCTYEDQIPMWIEECYAFPEDTRNKFGYLVFNTSNNRFETLPMNVTDKDIDVELSYNDNLPNEGIMNFLESDESGLVVLHGDPGTGKSTYIRHVIMNTDKECIYIDQSSFSNITDAGFINTLIQHDNSILVIEDCESLIADRGEEANSAISSLLNITDGLLGDSMKFKIICTFNAELTKIDDALLRKGRLKIRYKFEELDKDKVKVLAEKLGISDIPYKDMTLADVYNYKYKADYLEKKKVSKIGFA